MRANELRVQITECSGTAFTSGSVVADFSNGDPQLMLRHQGGGVWSTQWTPLAVTNREVSITLFASTALRFDGNQIAGSVRQSAAVVIDRETVRFAATPTTPRTMQTIELMNVGGREESVNVVVSERTPWLSVSPGNLRVPSRGTIQITVTVDPAIAGIGLQTGSLTIVSQEGRAYGTSQISLLVEPTPQLTAGVPAITATVNAGGSTASPSLRLNNNNATPITYTIQPQASWLSVSPSEGTISAGESANVSLAFDPSGLQPGVYNETLFVRHSTGAQLVVPAVFIVRPQPVIAPALAADVPNIQLTALSGGSSANATVPLRNRHAIALRYAASVLTRDGASWLTVNPAAALIESEGSGSVTLAANPVGLAPGAYEGQVLIVTEARGVLTVPVMLTVGAGLQVSATSLEFQATESGAAPAPQTFSISNRSSGTLSWILSVSTGSGGNWLSASPRSGSSAGGGAATSSVSVSVQPQGLAIGTYSGEVRLSTTGTSEVLTVAVGLTVTSGQAEPALTVEPSSLLFTARLDSADPAAQTLQLRNRSAAPIAIRMATATTSGGSWLRIDRTEVIVSPGADVPITVQARIQGLTPGQYRGAITVLPANAPARIVTVTLTITSDTPICRPTNLHISLITPAEIFTATVRQPVRLEVHIVDSCGVPATRGSVLARFSNGGPNLTLDSVGEGIWSKTWQPATSTPSRTVVTITAIVFLENNRFLAQQVQLTATIQGQMGVPSLRPQGVRNAASFQPDAPLAPGTLVTIFGEKFSDCNPTTASVTPAPTELCGVEVRIGERPMPLLFVSDTQINGQIPFDIPVNTTQQVIVRRLNSLSAPEAINIVPAAPGIFTVSQTGSGQATVLTAGGAVADPRNPLQAGSVGVLFGVGFGAVEPPIAAGMPVLAGTSHRVAAPMTVTIGGRRADVLFAGLTEGFTGRYEVRFLVPEGITPGDAVPLAVTIGDQTSPTVTVAVR